MQATAPHAAAAVTWEVSGSPSPNLNPMSTLNRPPWRRLTLHGNPRREAITSPRRQACLGFTPSSHSNRKCLPSLAPTLPRTRPVVCRAAPEDGPSNVIDVQHTTLDDQEPLGPSYGYSGAPPSPAVRSGQRSWGIRDVVRIALLLGAAGEVAIVGSLLWSPLLALVTEATAQRLEKKESEARERGQGAVSRDNEFPDLMATEPETPAWMKVFLENWWPSAIEVLISKSVVKTLQQILDRAVPAYVPLQVKRFYLGRTPPLADEIQVLFREKDRKMELMEVGAVIDSQDLSILIEGSAPVVGNLLIDMNDFDVSGRVQLWTLPDERLILINFKDAPKLKIGMVIRLFGRKLLAGRILCHPIESILSAAIKQLMLDRRRVLVPLEIEDGESAESVDGLMDIQLLSCTGLRVPCSGPFYQVGVKNAVINLTRKSRIKESSTGAPKWKKQHFKLPTGDKSAIFSIEARELNTRKKLGVAVFSAASLPDGGTAFWAAGADGKPLAKRWFPGTAPWEVSVPLEDPITGKVLPGAFANVKLSAVKWLRKQPEAPMVKNYLTPGPRSVILRVLEATNVGDDLVGARFVQVKYDGITKSTQMVTLSNNPVWNSTFVYDEDTRVQARTMRITVLSPRSFIGASKDSGCVFLNLDSLYEGQPLDTWMELGGTERGRLHIVADIVPGRADSEEVQERAKENWTPDTPYLKLEVTGARNLPAGDMDGYSDPYVIIRMGRSSSQTQVVRKTLNPTFNHTAILPLCRPGTPLKLACLDYDFMSADDHLGTGEVDLSEVLVKEGQEYGLSVPLVMANGKRQGEILLKITRTGSFDDVVGTGSAIDDSMDEQPPDQIDLFQDSIVEMSAMDIPPEDPEKIDWYD